MGASVEIYLKYAGPGQRLAHRVAEALDLTGYFYSGTDYVLPLDARLVGAEGWGQLTLAATDLGRDGDPGLAARTAYEPYEYELAIEFRGPVERLGEAVFERLTGLGLPLAYGDYLRVFADFLPGRGRRDLPPDTSAEDSGRARWYEPALHRDPRAPWPAEEPSPRVGRVTVFETDGLLQFVPVTADHGTAAWARPVASTRSNVDAADLGLLLCAALGTTVRPPGPDDPGAVLAGLAGRSRLSTEDFPRRSVSFEVRAEPGELVATARDPGAVGPATTAGGNPSDSGGVALRGPKAAEPHQVGELLLDLIGRLRARAAGE